ncbi:hypothetical protein [Paenibacillus sp. Soil522]|uniref:hypothetical protein n=1 Tax=Paenibacillus sp. Soil522 TaxID=1736388 RepID=UPI0006F5D842|nr:hypothetical protein [Paenibacillus sp. Soil522]KRE49333.1 hypothetical protein ASG81_05125 [Paenibacillus sp. Soil522]
MSAIKKFLGIAIGSYAVALVVYWISSPYIAIAIPGITLLVAFSLRQRDRKEINEPSRGTELQQQPQNLPVQQPIAASTASVPAAAQSVPSAAAPPLVQDPELASALEYIGIIEDMILLEGEKNNLDDEIVQKTLALLSRLNRLIPDLVALGDSSINHNIVRLVRKDLNSTINPFLRLSGEAKRQNRRLLLDGIKDVDSKLTFYTKTIEQKDLMELRTKAELMQQRYRLTD